MAPFRRVVRVAKPIVKARKPQSCALFSSQILRFCYRCPAFCSCVPVLCSAGRHSAPVSRYSAPVASHSTSGGPAFCHWLPAILLHVAALLLPLVRHSASGCPQFYLRCPGLCSHSTFYLPKGSLSPSLFCFSVPNVQYYVTKAHYYHIQANIPCNSRTKTPILCSGRWEGGIGNRKSGLPANHRAHFKNANTS